MCIDPATLALISAGVQTVGTISQANYNAALAENRAQTAREMEKIAAEQGAEEKSQHRARVRALAGKQVSQMAASGAAIDSSDSLRILSDTAVMGEYDEQAIDRNTDLRKWAYRNEAQAALADAKMQKTSGYFDALGTVLTGASKYSKFKRYS